MYHPTPTRSWSIDINTPTIVTSRSILHNTYREASVPVGHSIFIMNLSYRLPVHSFRFSLLFLLLLCLTTFTQSRHIPITATQQHQQLNSHTQFLNSPLIHADEEEPATEEAEAAVADTDTKEEDTTTTDADAKAEDTEDTDDKTEDDTKDSTSEDEDKTDDKTDDTETSDTDSATDTDEKETKAAETTEPSTNSTAGENDEKEEKSGGFSGNLLGALIAIIVAGGIGGLLWCLWRKRRVANMNRMPADDDFTQPVVGRGDII